MVEVDWAAELGLDRRLLWREHPGHPNQLKAKALMYRQSELFWGRQRLQDLWETQGEVGNDRERDLQE